MKSVLEKRFPLFKFAFRRFIKSDLSRDFNQKKSSSPSDLNAATGFIYELKVFDRSHLALLDQMWKRFKDKSSILVLTPEVFQLLNQARANILSQCAVILSESKSLDYMLQLPRVIDDASRKSRLKTQNERLRRMMEKTSQTLAGYDANSQVQIPLSQMAAGLREEAEHRALCGLRVSLKRWNVVKQKLGPTAHKEVMLSIGRLINSAVRNSDRVLHWKEDEFLIFLSNTEPTHLASCRQRVESSLSSIELTANRNAVSLPFAVKSLEQMSFLN